MSTRITCIKVMLQCLSSKSNCRNVLHFEFLSKTVVEILVTKQIEITVIENGIRSIGI